MKNGLMTFLALMSLGALAAPRDQKIINFFKETNTKIENPLELRDPFKVPRVKSDGRKERKGYVVTSKGHYSNITRVPSEQLLPQQIKVVGVLIGKERRALVHASADSKEVIILKGGMKIGPDEAELKAILPGGIVLVEKMINVYGQEEYLETVIPISR